MNGEEAPQQKAMVNDGCLMLEWVMHVRSIVFSLSGNSSSLLKEKKNSVNKNISLNVIRITRISQQLLHSYRDEQEDADQLFSLRVP